MLKSHYSEGDTVKIPGGFSGCSTGELAIFKLFTTIDYMFMLKSKVKEGYSFSSFTMMN